MKNFIVALSLWIFCPLALAVDGATFQSWCSQAVEKAPGVDPTTFRDGYCMGVTETVIALSSRGPLHAFCAPERTGQRMLLRVVLAYLKAHPEQLSKPAEGLVIKALGETYPCGGYTITPAGAAVETLPPP